MQYLPVFLMLEILRFISFALDIVGFNYFFSGKAKNNPNIPTLRYIKYGTMNSNQIVFQNMYMVQQIEVIS